MTRNPTLHQVVAAAISDAKGRLLLQRRPAGKRHAGMWEFPGGKVEHEEDQRDALARELAEELALELDPAIMQPLGSAQEAREDAPGAVVLVLYSCPGWTGVPQALEGQSFGWFSKAEARDLPLAPMDRELLEVCPG